MLVLVLLAVLSPLLEGIGINALIPLISFFQGGVGSNPDVITRAIQGMFAFFSIPFTFRYLLVFIFSLFIIRAVSVVVFGYVRGWVNADFLSKESGEVMRSTLLATWPFMLQQKIGSMHNTLVRDVQQAGSLMGAAVQILQSFSGFLMYLLVAINIAPAMTTYAIVGGGFLFLVLRPLLRRTRIIGQRAASAEKQFAQFLSEHIIAMKAVKAAGVERAAINDGTKHIRLLRDLSIRQYLITTLGSSFFQPFAMGLVILLFFISYNSPGFNLVSFAASLYLIQKIFTYLESGQNSLQSIQGLLPYVKNVTTFKQALATHREQSGGTAPFMFTKSLEFKKVSFAYDAGRPVLEDVSFSIRAGETVGLIGPSGAGKTSIADLLLRLFSPQRGDVLLDGVLANGISLEEWRKHIGYVSQEVFLLHATIEENIRFYNHTLTKEEIVRAAKQANIYDFIMGLPAGFETVTGDRGVMLSGGQRQRIALARALAANPSLLILDEATSALDHESEKLIQESIRALHGKITVFIIAHRPSTLAEADTIIVLASGHVVAEGSPKALLADPESYFAKMQQRQ